MNKLRGRNNRRISLNGFKKSCDIQPFLQIQEQGLSSFQTSLMLMQILKKHENLVFANKENEVSATLEHFYQQNQLLQRIKDQSIKKKQSRVLLSSFRVLEDLDLNRKYAYSILEQENKQISDRIFTLQTALEKMACSKKRQTLCPEYLQKLESKLKSRRKVEEKLKRIMDEMDEEYDEMVDKAKVQLIELVKSKMVSQEDNIKQMEMANLQILETIFAKLDQ